MRIGLLSYVRPRNVKIVPTRLDRLWMGNIISTASLIIRMPMTRISSKFYLKSYASGDAIRLFFCSRLARVSLPECTAELMPGLHARFCLDSQRPVVYCLGPISL